jgi:hypothetical protein
MTTLYMLLLNEGTDVWRPISAESVGAGTFRILGPLPNDEVWQFLPGSVVTTAHHRFSDGSSGIIAVALHRA